AADVDERFAEARSIGEAIVGRALTTLGRQVGAAGTIRFNPSTFERDGVPALGWSVGPDEHSRLAGRHVNVREGDDGSVAADDIELVLLDEPDVGDLYTFCPAAEDQVPWGP